MNGRALRSRVDIIPQVVPLDVYGNDGADEGAGCEDASTGQRSQLMRESFSGNDNVDGETTVVSLLRRLSRLCFILWLWARQQVSVQVLFLSM